MKQTNTLVAQGLPLTCNEHVSLLKTRRTGGAFQSSSKWMLLCGIFVLSLFIAGSASAVPLTTTAFSCTRTTTATSSCVAGFFASGWSTSGTDYWSYTVTTTGYTSLTMQVASSSSATGPHNASVYYNIGGSDVPITTYTLTGTSCGSSGVVHLPSACDNQPSVVIKIKMNGATSTSGTNRVNSDGAFNGLSIADCATYGTPAAGSLASSASTVCSGASPVLTFTPGSAGSNLTYAWSGPGGAIPAATDLTYSPTLTSTVTAAETFTVIATCPTNGLSSAGATTTVTVNPIPDPGTISPSTATIATGGATQTFVDGTGTGTWSSGSSAIATVGSTGIATSTSIPGTTTVRYTVSALGCFASTTATLTTHGTLATYNGNSGTSTSVTAEAANETAGALTAFNFGSTTTCASGGLSGITVSTVNPTYAAATGPHVYFLLTPNSGYHLNVTGIMASTRESGTGPTKARLAYSLDGGTNWTDNGDQSQATTGSCGDNTNPMNWASFSPVSADDINGILVAVYPYAPGASSGTFQVQSIVVNGTVAAVGTCTTTPTPGAISPSATTICGGTSATLTLSGGSSFTDQTYQWYDGGGLIMGATNATYMTAVVSPTTTVTQTYTVVSTCPVFGSASSAPATVTVNPIPDAGMISGGSSVINTGTTLALTDGTGSGVWSSSNTTVAIVGSTGVVTGLAPGASTISYTVTSLGCTGVATYNVTDVTPGNLATYTGSGGTSLTVVGVANESVTDLTATSFGTASPCTSGGLSGITVSTVVATYSESGPHVSFSITPNPGYQLDITGISAITRESGSGPTKARLAYSFNNIDWTDDGAPGHDQATTGSCGANTNSFSWAGGITLSAVTSTIYFAVYPYAPTASSGTFQVNEIAINGVVTTTTTCTSTPAAGTAVATLPSFCGSGSALLAVTGGSSDAGLQYQWYNSLGSISGATNATFTTPVISASETYSVVTTCPGNGSSTSSPATVTIISLPNAGTITGTSPIPTSSTTTYMSDGDAGGLWTSNNSTVATIGSSSGVINATPVPGTSIIRYTVSASGCSASTTATLNTVAVGTLATYTANDGVSTVVTPEAANETVGALTAVNFGSATACGSGGLSGLTVRTVNNAYDEDSAHVYFLIAPNPGYELNVTDFRVISRSSGTGPTKARLAYSLNGGGSWTSDLADHTQLTTGSCGANTNIYGWDGGFTPVTVSCTSGILVAVYPYTPGANTGTFQVQNISIDGTVSSIIDQIAGDATYGFTASSDGGCPNNIITLTDATGSGDWSTSDDGVAATIDPSTGIIVGISNGTATITYTPTSPIDYTGCNYVVATVTVTGDCGAKPAPSGVSGVLKVADIKLYPNPANSMLNISAAEKVNVAVMSVDGKVLIEQKDAVSVDVSNLADGLYIIKIYNQENALIKTAKFNVIK